MSLNNYTHHYTVGDHSFSISTYAEIDIMSLLPSYQLFREEKIKNRLLFELCLSKKLSSLYPSSELAHFELDEAKCIIKETSLEYEIVIIPEQDGIVRKMLVDKSFSAAKAELIGENSIDIMVLNNFIMMLYAFASAPYNTLLVHASVINYKEKGYLFLGKSGTGKSTHSRLWLENTDTAELLNDDNPVIRFESEEKALVYGSPWSGKTPCYKNKVIEIGAIVHLKQAPYNKIIKQSTIQSFTSLLSSCSCLKQAETIKEDIYDTVAFLTAIVPTYKLECLPNNEAVTICKETIATEISNAEN